eukprot:XP_011681543.1 PREDICTED: uncharacterized protein LOC105446427 [Strongylocentrotus purpuratus]
MDFLSSSPELKSVDENWTCITSLINKCKDEFIPSKMSRARRNLPWITISLKRQMRKRDRLFKRARSQPSASNWKAYRQLRNELTKRVRQAHHNYVCNIIGESLYANPKAFWSYVKQRRSENFGIPPLRNDNKLHITNKDKAECLNNYFHSTFTKSNVDQVCINRPSLYNDIGHLHIHRSGVVKQLLQLNPSKASGPDEIHPRLLKMLAHEIAPALSFLFQQSYNTGEVPLDWKRALVAPIHKAGDKCCPGNYRPISLTCICSKVMEHIMLYSHISKHLAANNIPIDEQHGFQTESFDNNTTCHSYR